MKHIGIQAVIITLLLSGCAYGTPGGKLGETGLSQVITQAPLPTPTQQDVALPGRAYLIGPQDKLLIDVFGIPELMAREIVTDAAGRISFPMAGTIDAAGLTPDQLAGEITTRLKASYIRDPQVTVNVVEAVSQMVTIDGQVKMPGNYPILPDMTLMRAVAGAQGLAEFAKMDDVVILRNVGGQRYAGLYNLGAIRQGNYSDPMLYPNDVVIVGDSAQRRAFEDFLQILPALTSPLIYLLANN